MDLKDMNNKRREELKAYFIQDMKDMAKTWQYLVTLNEKTNEFESSEKAQNLISKIWNKTVRANNVKDELGLLNKMTGLEIFNFINSFQMKKSRKLYAEYMELAKRS